MDSAGEVADGEIITMPLGIAAFCSEAVVSPEHMPPTMPLTLSEVISRSAEATARPASMQPVSPFTETMVVPSMKFPDSLISAIARLAPAAMSGARDSSGPVKPRRMPIFTSSA